MWEGSSALTATVPTFVQLRSSRTDARVPGSPLRWFACHACRLPPRADELGLARGDAGVMAVRFAGRVEISWDVDVALAATLPWPR